MRPLRRTNDTGFSRWVRASGVGAALSDTLPGYRARATPSASAVLLRDGHEVDELLDAAEERRLEVAVGLHRAEDALPGAREVGLVPCRPAERAAHPHLELDAPRHLRPARDADGA